jgi:hypothetical protein
LFFDKGKINISIQKTNYAPGDMITGDISLSVKKPVKAKEMDISLVGEQKTTSMQRVSGSTGMQQVTQVVRIYDFKQQLDGEKEYSGEGNYHFEIKIPAGILGGVPQMPDMGSGLGQGLKIAAGLAAMAGAIPARQIRWFLQAKLDIQGGLDINKTTDITIG